MTALLLLRILARRWYVVLAVAALTGFAFVSLGRSGGAYTAETKVVFVAPGDDAVGAFDARNQATLVDFAAVVEREFHRGQPADRLAENASLFGAGIQQGYQVLVPNSGGQWQYSFSEPALSVKVVGPSSEWVSTTLDRLLARIDSLSADLQRQGSIGADNLIQSERVPAEPAVSYVGSSRSTQARALLALALVGSGVAAALAVGVDRLSSRPSQHRRTESPVSLPLPKERVQ